MCIFRDVSPCGIHSFMHSQIKFFVDSLNCHVILKKVNRIFLVKTEKHSTACDNRQVMEIFEKLPYLCFHIALGLKSRPPPLQCQLGWCHDYFAIRPTQPTQPIYCNRGRLCIHMESIYNGYSLVEFRVSMRSF